MYDELVSFCLGSARSAESGDQINQTPAPAPPHDLSLIYIFLKEKK